MQKTLKLTFLLAILLFVGAVFSPNKVVLAHAGEVHEATETPPPTADIIEFEAPKGGSLSLLVRRGLQIVDKEDEKIALSGAQIIYAETNIVNQLGSKQLEIGEHVKLEKKLLKEYAAKSQELSAAKVAGWQKYADKANFNLEGVIEPIGTQETTQGAPAAESTPNAEQEGPLQTGITNQDADAGSAKDDIGRAWLIGISVLVIAYYLTNNLFELRRPSSSPRTRQSRRGRK